MKNSNKEQKINNSEVGDVVPKEINKLRTIDGITLEPINDEWFHLHDSKKTFDDAFKEWQPHIIARYIYKNVKDIFKIPIGSFLNEENDYIFYTDCEIPSSKSYWKEYLNVEFEYRTDNTNHYEVSGKKFKLNGIEAFALPEDILQHKFGFLCKIIEDGK